MTFATNVRQQIVLAQRLAETFAQMSAEPPDTGEVLDALATEGMKLVPLTREDRRPEDGVSFVSVAMFEVVG